MVEKKVKVGPKPQYSKVVLFEKLDMIAEALLYYYEPQELTIYLVIDEDTRLCEFQVNPPQEPITVAKDDLVKLCNTLDRDVTISFSSVEPFGVKMIVLGADQCIQLKVQLQPNEPTQFEVSSDCPGGSGGGPRQIIVQPPSPDN